jgi:hypothetical protein
MEQAVQLASGHDGGLVAISTNGGSSSTPAAASAPWLVQACPYPWSLHAAAAVPAAENAAATALAPRLHSQAQQQQLQQHLPGSCAAGFGSPCT